MINQGRFVDNKKNNKHKMMDELQRLSKEEVWNVPTLKSREILETGLKIETPRAPPATPKKVKKKSLWKKVRSVMTCSTTEEYIVTQELPTRSESDELKRLNELRLLTLSYEAEMAELKEEISKLTTERAKLKSQRQSSAKLPRRKIPASPSHSLQSMGRVSSSSGFSEMSTIEKMPSLASTLQRLEDAKILYIC